MGAMATTDLANTRLQLAREHLARAPGKRLRPRLVLASALATGGQTARAAAARAAEAVECIHTYSLVHDDLPAMDDDDLRRGQPTLHVEFDEATAILVGDGLQAEAFAMLATDDQLDADQRVALISCLGQAAGFGGMVGGQGLDMAATGRLLSLDELKSVHALKTGALIRASLLMGAIVARANASQTDTLREIGEKIGLAFQIIDDVIDVRSDSAILGKTGGKDAAAQKSTYVSLMGIDAAEAEATRLYNDCQERLADWNDDAQELRELLAKMVKRDR